MLAAQYRYLVAGHQQLGVLRRRRPCRQRPPPGQADEHQVEHPYHHTHGILPDPQLTRPAYPQVSHL
jgi:hypothetical protein